MEKKKFRQLFPNLADEMENGRSAVDLEGNPVSGRAVSTFNRKWAGYDPDITDFIRRCETNEQATEIIDYMERQTKISPEEADRLRKQLAEDGLRSFGMFKETGFYNKSDR